jgi:UPF0755 protein
MKLLNLSNSKFKALLIGILLLFSVAFYFGLQYYKIFFAQNVATTEKYLYIKTGSDFEDLITQMRHKNTLEDIGTFWQAAEKMNFSGTLKPGKYRIKIGMNNRSLINMLKAGNQEPVMLKFQNLRKTENFAALLAKNLEPDSLAFVRLLDSASYIQQFGFTKENILAMFIPNTYELYWSVSPEKFIQKMDKEYKKFWNESRLAKAKKLNLSPIEVNILASIVDAEALHDKEMPAIAGLYVNRLQKGILLQADPTVIFANNDFTVKRVTNSLLNIDSEYNTYRHKGLPPGPINMPSINAIDAVLNKENNNYLYMCANEDFSGYHNFASNEAEHKINAKKYQAALNARKIFR